MVTPHPGLADAPLLRAARGLPAPRVPVWFMRQAGRSLPEYRALRGEGSILDAIRDPALSAEITLQPVRRYGVDAAILYSDIVVPAAAIGFGVDVTPGVGPGRQRAVPLRGRPRPAAPLRARRRRALRRRDGAPRGRRARRHAAHRLRRRAVHGRQLPDRGSPVAHLRAHQGDDARRPGAVARAARPPGRHGHRLAARPGRRRGQRHPALRLVGRRAGARRLPRPRAARQRQGVRRPRGHAACPASTSAWAPASCSRSWATPAPTSSASTGGCRSTSPAIACPARRCRATSTRPCASRRGTSSPTAPVTCCAATPAGPGHIFNLGHGVLPELDPGVLAQVVDLVHEEGRTDGG